MRSVNIIRSIATTGALRHFALLAMFAALMAGCSKPKNDADTAPYVVEEVFYRASKPSIPVTVTNATAATPTSTAAAPAAASAQWNPGEIYQIPLRPWLPPAETPELPTRLPGDLRITTSSPASLPDSALPTVNVGAPGRLALPAPAPAQFPSPDPTLVTVFIATGPAPEMRGRQPLWDRPQLTTDPTLEMSRSIPLDAPIGLRETTPPLVRVDIPLPAGQIRIAGLSTSHPEIDPPVAPFTRPALPALKIPEQK